MGPESPKVGGGTFFFFDSAMNRGYRDRKYNSTDNDRLLRALSQPVQAWYATMRSFLWLH